MPMPGSHRRLPDTGAAGEYIVPAIAGSVMIIASMLPWLRSSLGDILSAWDMPVYLGWPFRIEVFNYGTLCLCSACCCFFLAFAHWKRRNTGGPFYGRTLSGLLCLAPFTLFLLQYLALDFNAMSLLAQQKTQMLLIQEHFGYHAATELIPLQPFAIDLTTFQGRFQLLVDQLQGGGLLSLLSGWLVFDYPRLSLSRAMRRQLTPSWIIGVGSLFCLLFLVMLIHAVGWNVCEYFAESAEAQGNYVASLQWLDRETFFDPSLGNAVFYHIRRGQVMFLNNSNVQSTDSRVYRASLLNAQKDYQDAYQQLLPVWQAQKNVPWVVDDTSNTLEYLTDYIRPAQIRYGPRNAQNIVQQDSRALPWVQLLTHIDAHNVYGHYILGRIGYDLQDYVMCKIQMTTALTLSSDADFQSSGYTYLALSDAGMGDYVDERILLLYAIQLDPAYRNNTARQELSGLR